MTIYAIILNEPNDSAWEAVRENWPNHHHILTDQIAFIAVPEDKLTLTDDIAEPIGLNESKKIRGLVIEAEHRAGFNDSSLVEWLGKFT